MAYYGLESCYKADLYFLCVIFHNFRALHIIFFFKLKLNYSTIVMDY